MCSMMLAHTCPHSFKGQLHKGVRRVHVSQDTYMQPHVWAGLLLYNQALANKASEGLTVILSCSPLSDWRHPRRHARLAS